MKSLPKTPGHLCLAPCHYGGMSAARKYSRVDLGYHAKCNRRVRNEGDRCWQHSAPVQPEGKQR